MLMSRREPWWILAPAKREEIVDRLIYAQQKSWKGFQRTRKAAIMMLPINLSSALCELCRRPREHFGKLVDTLKLLLLLNREHTPDFFRSYVRLYNHPFVERKPGGWLYLGRFYPDYLHVGGASWAILREAQKFCHGNGLDVGAGLWPMPGAVPVDLARGPGAGIAVADFADDTQDYIFSSHCLEHAENWTQCLVEWVRKLKSGGILFLYLPHPDCAIWNPDSPFVGGGHKWIPTPEKIKWAMNELGMETVKFDDGPDAMQSFFVCSRKPDRRVTLIGKGTDQRR